MIRIVLVEDHASFRQALAAVLSLQPDLQVSAQLGTGDVAAATRAAAEADVVVVDLELPQGEGVGILTALREDVPAVRAIVLTGLRDDRELGRAVEAGAAAVISKTAEVEEIVTAVRTVAAGGTVLPAEETTRRLRALARDRERRWRADVLAGQLTPRETEILEHLVFGQTNVQIGRHLGISPETVQTHIRNLMGKLSASSRLEAVSLALQHGLVDPP